MLTRGGKLTAALAPALARDGSARQADRLAGEVRADTPAGPRGSRTKVCEYDRPGCAPAVTEQHRNRAQGDTGVLRSPGTLAAPNPSKLRNWDPRAPLRSR